MASKQTRVAPVPRGYRTLTPCLTVAGVEQAIEFYRSAFGAEEVRRIDSADGTWVLHAELKIGNSMLMLAEENPYLGMVAPGSLGGVAVSSHLYVRHVETFVEAAIAAGAVESVPLTDTYWGDRMAQLVDPFGHVWTVASRVERLSGEEIAERARALTSLASDKDIQPEFAV